MRFNPMSSFDRELKETAVPLIINELSTKSASLSQCPLVAQIPNISESHGPAGRYCTLNGINCPEYVEREKHTLSPFRSIRTVTFGNFCM